MQFDLDERFPRYEEHDPEVPCWCITPETPRCMHRWFDTSPISPSGQYVALTRIPQEDRDPRPGEPAWVEIVDLERGERVEVAETQAWDTQLGACVQWGESDEQLIYNRMDTDKWEPYGVIRNPFGQEEERIDGPIYAITSDGWTAASPQMIRTGMEEPGFGVRVPDKYMPDFANPRELMREDGIWITDLATNDRELLASFDEIRNKALDPDTYRDGVFFAYHLQWNRQDTALMFMLRFFDVGSERVRHNVITMSRDGAKIHAAIEDEDIGVGICYPSWHNDGRHLLLNLRLEEDGGEVKRLAQVRDDGSNLGIVTDEFVASGHPSVHPEGHIVAMDASYDEEIAERDIVPIRLMEMHAGTEVTILRVKTMGQYEGRQRDMRVLPQPAWGPDGESLVFNAWTDGNRRVYLADCSEFV